MRSSCTAMLALVLSANAALAGAQPAQPLDPTQKFNEPLAITDCVGQFQGGDPYPYSVEAIRQVLTEESDQVDVLVVDNEFYGYENNDPSDPSDHRVRISTRNFPKGFFSEHGQSGDFSPWLGAAPADPDAPDTPMARHGTHVAGIVLGGMYDDNKSPEGTGLSEPSARSLLLSHDKPWLRISFLTIEYGSTNADGDPVTKLNQFERDVDRIAIVNMSLAKALTGSEDIEELAAKNPLIVTSAGNSGKPLTKSARTGIAAVPASLDDDGRILVVASYDADGRLSDFSNYGPLVNIAAPGCKIKSWIDGKTDAVPLSGTSMATGIVTFAAALVRNQWNPPLGARAIRSRILASARFNPALHNCANLTNSAQIDLDTYCVKDGAMLDIMAAANVGRDLIEFDECGAPAPQGCKPTIAIGTMVEQAPSLASASCVADKVSSKLLYFGLSKNGAAKRIDREHFLVQYETGWQVGAEQKTKICSVPADSDDQLQFQIERKDAPAQTKPIKLKDLRRLVMRAK